MQPTRTVVITGASRGLGAGVAARMLSQGIHLGLCARSECALAAGERVLTAAVDVRDERAVFDFAEAVVARFGQIDVWINNAGVLEPIAFARDLSADALREHFDVNVVGVLHGSKAFAAHVRGRAGAGVLINISSGAALKGYAGWTAYSAGKAAVDRLTECVQHEEASHGLRAYSVAPGVIDTGMQELIRSQTEEQFPLVEKFKQLKRDEAFNSPLFVADQLLDIAFGTASPDAVVVRLTNEPKR